MAELRASNLPQPIEAGAIDFTFVPIHRAPVLAPAGGATTSWWWSCLVVVFALGFLVPARSQAIDTFKVWYLPEVPLPGNGSGYASNLPNFWEGRNAVGYGTTNRSPIYRTVLNAFPGDTSSVFSWSGGLYLIRGDFIGNEATDYVDPSGNLYLGIEDGSPPRATPYQRTGVTPSQSSPPGNYRYGFVEDLDQDGKLDIVSQLSMYSAMTIFFQYYTMVGDSMQRVDVPYSDFGINDSYKLDRWEEKDRRLVGVFRNESGNLRLLVCRRNVYEGASFLELYSCEKIAGSKQVRGRFLSRTRMSGLLAFQDPKALFTFQEHGDGAFIGQDDGTAYFVSNKATFVDPPDRPRYVQNLLAIYAVVDDSVKFLGQKEVPLTWSIDVLERSVDGDQYRDWYWADGRNQTIVFSGDLAKDLFKPVGCLGFRVWRSTDNSTARLGSPPPTVVSVEDINGDSIPDMVTGCPDNNLVDCFGIVLGKKIVSTVSNPDLKNGVSVVRPIPYSNSRGGDIELVTNVGQLAEVLVYGLDGTLVCKPNFSLRFSLRTTAALDLGNCKLPPGSYVIRLKGSNNVSFDHKVIVED